jgi:hypothetical protein
MKTWTTQEILLLKETFKEKSKEELEDIFKRSYSSISKRASRLDLHKDEGFDSWSSEEENILKNLYSNATQEIILESLPKRSWSSILNKALRLGIHRDQSIRISECSDTKKNRYGENLEIIQDKIVKTNLERYGVNNTFQVEEFKEKIKGTNLEKYGVPNPSQNNIIKNKKEETCLKNFGVTSPLKHLDILSKVFKTKKERGNCSTSQIEEDLNFILKEESKRQYNEDIRYPFNCDFYLENSDCFIELQGNWTHGEEPYNGYNEPETWCIKAKTSKYYQGAVKTYTESDPIKRVYASLFNLNFLEIWKSDIRKGWDWVEFLLTKQGLPLIFTKEIIQTEFRNISDLDGDFTRNPNQNRIIKKFQPHFYRKERELWNNPRIREKLVENREKYKFKPKEELTNQELLAGFKISGAHIGYSFFSPLWIKAFIEKYNVKSIYDPCMGWGHRLLGACDITYIGNDICPETYQGNKNISEYFQMENKTLYNHPAEEFIPEESYDAVFTCPPYFDTEIYEGEGTSSSKYSSYASWLNVWWRRVVQNSLVRKPKYFSFVINNKYKEDMRRICEEEGLLFLEEIPVGKNSKNHFQRSSENSFKGEFILILINK